MLCKIIWLFVTDLVCRFLSSAFLGTIHYRSSFNGCPAWRPSLHKCNQSCLLQTNGSSSTTTPFYAFKDWLDVSMWPKLFVTNMCKFWDHNSFLCVSKIGAASTYSICILFITVSSIIHTSEVSLLEEPELSAEDVLSTCMIDERQRYTKWANRTVIPSSFFSSVYLSTALYSQLSSWCP